MDEPREEREELEAIVREDEDDAREQAAQAEPWLVDGMTRELAHPNVTVTTRENGSVLLRFHVPGSKFGPVEVVLYAYEAAELLVQLHQQVRP